MPLAQNLKEKTNMELTTVVLLLLLAVPLGAQTSYVGSNASSASRKLIFGGTVRF
jgi:hypothetical protein